MNKQQRLEAIANAMEYTGENPPEHTKPNIYVISGVGGEVYDLLLDIVADLEAPYNVNYEILARACGVISELDLDEVESAEWEEDFGEHASVYTADRLGYLSINNQDEITNTMKEYECDIQTACAIWFDHQVRDVAHKLIDWILEGEEA